MTTPQAALSLTLLALQGALLIAAIYLLIKAHRRDRAARHHPTPAAYWQHRAQASDTRTAALLLIIASLTLGNITTALN